MSFYDAIRVGSSIATEDYDIGRSLRFQSSNSDYLNRTFGTNTSNTTKTASVWVKRSKLGAFRDIFSTTVDGYIENRLEFTDNDQIQFVDRNAGSSSSNCLKITKRRFRDVSAWYHIVVAVDTTDSTAEDRYKLYINGVRETDFSGGTNTNFPQNHAVSFFRSSVNNYIGVNNSSSYFFDGYLAEINFIDGQALTPLSFGQTKATTGQWLPKEYVGSYGNNGFYLNFSDNSGTSATTLGKDSSGNSNNFTPNNFSVSAGTGNSSVTDTPTNNFPVWNSLYASPLQTGGPTVYTYANLRLATNTAWPTSGQFYPFGFASFGARSGKWYAEIKNVNAGGSIGIANNGQLDSDVTNNPYGAFASTSFIYTNSGEIRTNDGNLAGQATYGAGDIIGIAMDLDNMKLYFHKNGSYINSGNPSTGSNGYTIGALPSDRSGEYIFSAGSNGASNGLFYINLGQIKTAGTSYADSEGIGSFDYAVPTGFKALCSKNLPDPTIELPNKHFNTLLYTGNDGTQSITGLNFSPDWVWIKCRSDVSGHQLYDIVRGATKRIYSNEQNAESTVSNGLTAFNSNGFSIGSHSGVNINSETYVAWNWDAGDTDSATYRVVVVSDSGNKYRFRNSANTATFAQSAVTLDLAEGGTYIFNMDDSTNASHPFSIGTAANGTVYTSGITYFLDGVSKTYSEYTLGFATATTRRLHITVPASAPQLYYWCSAHSGMGGAINTNSTLGSSNFDGSIQSTAKVNATAGFSIVGYTGTNGTGTIGHGLGVAPQAYFVKRRDNASDFRVYHQSLGNTKAIKLNVNEASATSSSYWNDTSPTSTTVSLGTDTDLNGSTDKYIAYCLSEVAGYSKFGSYTSNGNVDGVFVFTGFRPTWVMLKQSSASDTAYWFMFDSTRSPKNVIGDEALAANLSEVEGLTSWNPNTSNSVIDFLSNGFKIRTTSTAGFNVSGETMIYFAFAESPFKNSRAR